MKKKNTEIVLYAALFCLAAGLRFYHLGNSPLSETEASAALSSFNLSKGQGVVFNAQAGYVLLTSILFYLFHANEFWARFLPALVGSAIVFSPLLFKDKLGKIPALILAAGLAIDPSLIISSRMADGSIFGIVFFLFALGFLLNRKSELVGVFAGLALLGATSIWFGVVVSLLTAGIYFILRKKDSDKEQDTDVDLEIENRTINWKYLLITFASTIVLSFSLFLFTSEGLSGIFSGLAGFIQGWSQTPDMTIGVSLWSILFYEGFPILLGIFTILAVFDRRKSLSIILAIFSIVSTLLLVLYPGSGFVYFPWISIPLWALLGKYVLADYNLNEVDILPYYGLMALILIAIIFGGINLKGILTGLTDTASIQMRVASILGALLIMLLGAGLVIWGWSVNTVTKAVFGAVLITLFFVNTSIIWNILNVQPELKQEVWLDNSFVDYDLLTNTINDYKKWNIGSGDQSSVLVSGIQSDELKWSLRDFDNVEYDQGMPVTYSPEMIITDSSQEPQLESEYAGQDFILSREPVWNELDTWGWYHWFFIHETPYVDNSIILWVRVDQFPGYEANELLPTE